MKVTELLGQKLKSPDVMDLLETHDVDVIYDFDRTYENLPDSYWAPLEDKGIQLKFDQDQNLNVIFVYRKEKEGFSIADTEFVGIEGFDTYDEVKKMTIEKAIPTTEGEADFLGEKTKWIRLEHDDHSVHYSFDPTNPDKITIQKRSEQGSADNVG